MLPPLHNAVFLDTETTGLGGKAEIIEIAIIDSTGEVLLDTYVKPTCAIEPGAAEVHGITEAMLVDASEFTAIWPRILAALRNRNVIIYNVDFDLRMIGQSAEVHGLDASPLRNLRAWCAMKAYADYWGDYDYYHRNNRWQSLGKAIRQQGLALPAGMRLHSALADAEMTRRLVLKMQDAEKAIPSA